MSSSISKVFNRLTFGRSQQTFCARHYHLQKHNKINIVAILDLTLGKDHCLLAYTNWIIQKEHKK